MRRKKKLHNSWFESTKIENIIQTIFIQLWFKYRLSQTKTIQVPLSVKKILKELICY